MFRLSTTLFAWVHLLGSQECFISDSLYPSRARTEHVCSPQGIATTRCARTLSGPWATWHVNHKAIPCLTVINSALAHPCQPMPNNIEVHLQFKLQIFCQILLQTASHFVCEIQRFSCSRVLMFRCFLYLNLTLNFNFPVFPELNIRP